MAQFDPAAATAAYLAQLPPEGHAKAQAYTQGDHWLLLWSAVVSVAIAWLVLRSGLLVKVRDGVERGKPGRWLAALAVALVYLLVEAIISVPWNIYADWWRETSYGQTSQPFMGWFAQHAISTVIVVIVTGLLVSGLYVLIRRAPKTWWLWSAGGCAVVIMAFYLLAPVVLMPIFNSFKPAPPGPVREAVVELAEANGVPSDKIYIYNGSKQSNAYTANVAGLFGTARVAMSDVMFLKGADVAEVRGVVGHEMGHYVLRHTLWSAMGMSVLALIAFVLIDRLFPRVAYWFGARDVRGLADPAGLPVIGILATVLGLLSTPLHNFVSRHVETAADQFSLERVNEPDGLSRALVKTIEYRAASPSALEEAIFYSHPAVSVRIRRAMDWKAAHPPTLPPANPPAAPAPQP